MDALNSLAEGKRTWLRAAFNQLRAHRRRSANSAKRRPRRPDAEPAGLSSGSTGRSCRCLDVCLFACSAVLLRSLLMGYERRPTLIITAGGAVDDANFEGGLRHPLATRLRISMIR